MRRCINISSDPWTLSDFPTAEALQSFYRQYGCDGLELILCGENFSPQISPHMVYGLHLIFYPEWIALWQDDFSYLDREFGSREAWQNFYQAKNSQELFDIYRHELAVAEKLGVEYVVFHIGDNALNEYFTLEPRRSNEEIIRESAKFLNCLMQEKQYSFQLLLENMWLGGMDLTEPSVTQQMLESVQYPNTGIMLDTGHLMVTNPSLQTADQACEYIHYILDIHGSLVQHIHGVHLHQSLSGEYFLQNTRQPVTLHGSYLDRYGQTAQHLSKVDPHKPFVSNQVPALIERIAPDFLVYELSRNGLYEWGNSLQTQHKVFKTEE